MDSLVRMRPAPGSTHHRSGTAAGRGLALVRRCRAALNTYGFAGITGTAALDELYLASCGTLGSGGVLGSKVAPANLSGYSLPNSSSKPKPRRGSAYSGVRCHAE